jgi:hypothetical protein
MRSQRIPGTPSLVEGGVNPETQTTPVPRGEAVRSQRVPFTTTPSVVEGRLDPEARREWTRSGSENIRRAARQLIAGQSTPLQALERIIVAARVSQLPGPIEWDKSSIWPIYAPFFAIGVRWWNAQQEGGELPPETIAALEAEVIEAARALMPASVER